MSVEDINTNAIRGWGCTPTGDSPPGMRPSQEGPRGCLSTVFMRGWRRTALYGILLFLMFLIFLNIGLTLWIIGSIKLNTNGIGPIRIIRGGIQVEGQTWVMDNLVTSTITSQVAQPITIHSYRNFTVNVAEPDNGEQSKLFIKRDHIEFGGRQLSIQDARGSPVFKAARDEVRVFSEALAVHGPGGVTVKSAIQAPLVQAPPAHNLSLESLTRKLELRAPQSIYLESRAGNIDIVSHGDIKLDSIVGAIKIEAQNIVLNNLKEAVISDKPNRNILGAKIYQLCACATGKLFLAAPDAPCAAPEDDTELCR